LYNTLFEFGIPKKQVRVIKMCLNATYSRVRVEKYWSDILHFKNCLKNEMLYRH